MIANPASTNCRFFKLDTQSGLTLLYACYIPDAVLVMMMMMGMGMGMGMADTCYNRISAMLQLVKPEP